MFKLRYIILFSLMLPIAVGNWSCSRYGKLLKSSDFDRKYDAAVDYYEEKDYYRAYQLFEELLPIFRGTDKAQQVYYYYAYCNYGLGDYLLAAYHFDKFTKTYPNNEKAEECQYMKAYCYYLMSPISSLDQTNTRKAIAELQLFINKYPTSEKVAQCNELIDNLRDKLQNKAFENAKLYYNIESYKAAITAFNNLLEEYPEIKQKDEVHFLLLRSHFKLAENSIIDKQEERYNEAIEAYRKYIDKFPNGEYIKEAETIFNNASKELQKLKSNKS